VSSPCILILISTSIHWKTSVSDIFFVGLTCMFKHNAFNISTFHLSCLIFSQRCINNLLILQMHARQYKVLLSFWKMYIHSHRRCFQLWIVYSALDTITSRFEEPFYLPFLYAMEYVNRVVTLHKTVDPK
jgi:hypothetical protein